MAPAELADIAHRALALNPSSLFRYLPGGRQERREGLAFTAWDMPGPGVNKVAVLGPAPALDRILALADTFFAGKSGGYGLLFEVGREHPVEDEVRRRGWVVVEEEPALVLPELPRTFGPLPTGLQVRCLHTEAELDPFYTLLEGGFELEAGSLRPLQPQPSCVHDPALAFLVGSWAGQDVAAASLACVERTAAIAGVATLPAYRRRGFGRALTAAALVEAAARGCTSAALHAGPLSHPLYVGMGFVPACRHRTYAPPTTEKGTP